MTAVNFQKRIENSSQFFRWNEKAAGIHRRQGLWLFEVQLVIQEVVGQEVEKDILHQEIN